MTINFATAFGAPLLPECAQLAEQYDFTFRTLHGDERDLVINDIIHRIDSDTQRIGDPCRQSVWELGWGESLDAYVGSDYNWNELVPKFIRPGQVLRVNRQLVSPYNRDFELNYVRVLQQWLFRKYFSDVDEIHEFGCGSGLNLIALAKIFPHKWIWASDFVPSAVELVRHIADREQAKIKAKMFDMKRPSTDYRVGPEDGVLTFGSIEQLAGNFHNFLSFLHEKKPKVCVHVEPIIELYDETNLIDSLAIKFHRKRGYSEAFLPALQWYAKEGRIELLQTTRLFFGSMMMEGYMVIAWRSS